MNKKLALLLLIAFCLLTTGCGATLVVDSDGDEPDADPNDGVCKTVNNNCTLRAAIMEANLSDDISKITFDSSLTISPVTNLPPLTSGNTQISGEGQLVILDGSQNTESNASGIQILDSPNNTIQGLRIRNFLYGIYILADEGAAKNNIIGMSPSSTDGSDEHNVLANNYIGIVIEGSQAFDNVISGNYIGVDANGTTPRPNELAGISIRNGAHHNLIGSITGDTVMEGGNLISGNGVGVRISNAVHNHISGNYIGTRQSGNSALSNGDGIRILGGANNNVIGLNQSGEGQPNLISGNDSEGIWIENSDYTFIAANYIGVTSTGAAALPNRFGIYLHGSGFNIIGTDGDGVNDANEGNLISGNNYSGIHISQSNSINNTIAGNMIGTNFDGSSPIGNASTGISTSGHSTFIGTNGDGVSDDLEGNLISGNVGQGILLGSTGNIVAGNIIGLDITGALPLPNHSSGITINQDSSLNLIGTNGDGTADDMERNIISGNGGQFNAYGIEILGTDNTIAGNLIGTDILGSAALSDHQTGIVLGDNADNNLIGTDGDGTADQAESNLISGNGIAAIEIRAAAFNQVSGNRIGTDLGGTTAVPNGYTSSAPNQGAVRLGDGSNNNVIGTDGDGSYDQIEGNLISGNAIQGIVIQGSNTFSNVVAGNKIGTDVSGGSTLGNAAGIEILLGAQYTRIGTNADGLSDPIEANIVSGNAGFGIRIDSPGNVIQGNFIGTDLAGTSDLGNGSHGILINNNAFGVGIGGSPEKANTIAYNNGAGIYVRKVFPNDPNDPNNVIITFNSIHSNIEEGIDLDDATTPGITPNDSGDADSGPNDFMNYPVLNNASSIMSSITIAGEIVDGLPSGQFEIQFFSNPVCDTPSFHGEGKQYIGSSTQQTDSNGNVQFLVTLPAMVSPGSFVTATATYTSKTSEFSGCVEVADAQSYMEKAEEEEYPCDRFVSEEMTVTTVGVNQDSGQLILYITNPFPFPNVGNDPAPQYTATLGEIAAEKCDHQGFVDRVYCIFYIPETYFDSRQTLQLFSNLCIPPIYINEGVSILAIDPDDPGGGDGPKSCNADDKRACIANGGTWNDDTCTCSVRY